MISYIIPLLSQYLSTGIFARYIAPIFALAFLATVPCIIRYIVGFRR